MNAVEKKETVDGRTNERINELKNNNSTIERKQFTARAFETNGRFV